MKFAEEGSNLTMHYPTGRRKHDRFFWVKRRGGPLGSRKAILMWDKKKRVHGMPRKSAQLDGMIATPVRKPS